MDANAIIEDYVNNVAAKLPRRLRNDIGLELRALLIEQLRSAAQESGRLPDSVLAMEVLRNLGAPDEVAARYVPRGFHIIEPQQAPLFVKLATFCVAVQWAITLPAVFSSRMRFGEWWLQWGFSALAWVGALAVWFGVASWLRRRFVDDRTSQLPRWTHWMFWLPGQSEWRPGEPEATERWAAMNSAPIGAALTIFFIAPAWILGHLLPAGTNTSWVLYEESFRRSLLLPLIVLMVMRLALFAAVALNERLRARTAVLRFGLWGCFVALLYWAVFGWRIFANAMTDGLFKAWLLIFLLINTIQMIVWIRRAAMRVRVPESFAAASK